MNHDEIIEQAARVLSAHETFTGKPHTRDHYRRQARALADAGLLTRTLPTRDEIADAIYDTLSGQYGDFHTPYDAADAVLALLKGQDA